MTTGSTLGFGRAPKVERQTSRVWYLLAVGLIVSAVALALIGFTQASDTVRGMQRVVMPGPAKVVLPLGRTTLFVETRSQVNGARYELAEGVRFQCTMVDPNGQLVGLTSSKVSVSYALAGFSGESTFDVEVINAGEHAVRCDTPTPFVFAIGSGIGKWLAIALVGVVPALIGGAMMVIVWWKRRGQRRRGVPA